VALALTRLEAPRGTWADLCAGPGGKAALLAACAEQSGEPLLAVERQHHRTLLVQQALDAAGLTAAAVLTADSTASPWRLGSLARVLVDAPCTGLGALRRRPEARWRRRPGDLETLVPLQRRLLGQALDSLQPAGVAAYVTCSPHPAETVQVVSAVTGGRDDVEVLDAPDLVAVPGAGRGPFVQLWPDRHGTDAMFLALLRRTGGAGA
jgi:16S rRNA (cytosine967-C5)-methyltransferase